MGGRVASAPLNIRKGISRDSGDLVATKHKRIFSTLKQDVDAIVLINGVEPNLDMSFFYATGIPTGLFESCVAIVKPSGVEVLSSELEELSARSAGARTTVFKSRQDRIDLVRKRLKGMKRIGVNSEEVTHANYQFLRKHSVGAKLIDVSEAIANARMLKDEEEIRHIERACVIASKTAETVPELVRRNQTETEAAAEINFKMMTLGASGPAFETNASFGPSSAEPHYSPGKKRLKAGQFALFDFGAKSERYVSDITRTFVCAKPVSKQKKIYEVVLQAQLAAIDTIRDGVHGKDVDMAARKIIDGSPFKGKFIHSTGHGIGLSVHDPGSVSSSRDMILKEGMVLTVEPGIYIKGFGGVRIEDDVLVTKGGCKILTKASKEFLSV